MTESKSPLARLVLFMFCLSVAGAFIAGVHYALVEQPQQQSVMAPTNVYDPVAMGDCFKECDRLYWIGTTEGFRQNNDCMNVCFKKYYY